MRNTQCQLAFSMSRPPRIGPAMGPSSIGIPRTAITEPTRSGPAALVRIIMPIGMSRPPPRPWTTRNATSEPMFHASAQSADPMVNRISDIM